MSALGLFRRVRITELDHGVPSRRDVLVTVEEAPATTLGYGGGVEGGRACVRAGATATARREVRDRAARVRRVRPAQPVRHATSRSTCSLARVCGHAPRRPTSSRARSRRAATRFRDYRAARHLSLAARVRHASDLLVTGFHRAGTPIELQLHAPRRTRRADAPAVARASAVSGRYVIERDRRCSKQRLDPEDKPLIDRLFPQVRLSTFSGALIRDTRDDLLGPTTRRAARSGTTTSPRGPSARRSGS